MTVALRSYYGFGTWLRSVWKLTIWGVSGIFWGLTFLPLPVFKSVFYYITLGLLAGELIRIVTIISLDCIGILIDDYSENDEHYPALFSTLNARGDQMEVDTDKETDWGWIDYLLEMSTITQMALAFPLYYQFTHGEFWGPFKPEIK